MKRTNRGFAVFTQFTDTYGADVRVQMSSAAGVRRCWVFAHGGGTIRAEHREDQERNNAAPHLSPAQARRMAKALLRFADGAE